MPHLKGIRLVNVHFNNATQFYDDFRMEFNGKNATYDLENGGGKSMLLLMLLQTVLPKSYLRREKPVSLIFQGGKNRTSHVATEWILDEGGMYKYLITGFCARKKRGLSGSVYPESADEDENVTSGDIDIQLIAPGHEIPKEIASRFGVNYLLNQDILQDGRRRVVVKDVRAEEDEERRIYIEPVQQTMF
jgi:hypothetical protein